MASVVDKQNIEKAKELIEQNDYISAQEILKALVKTRRFDKHSEVQRLLKLSIVGGIYQDREASKPSEEAPSEPLRKASRHRLWEQQAKEKTWWYKAWQKLRAILPF
jgi:hypothetical protein